MAGARVYVGTGTSIVFGTSGYSAELLGLDWSGVSRGTVETSHMGMDLTPVADSIGNAIHIPHEIVHAGELTATVHFDPTALPPMVTEIGAANAVVLSETITVIFPTVGADSTPADWEFEGFCKGFSVSAPHEDVMTATLDIRITAGVDITAAA